MVDLNSLLSSDTRTFDQSVELMDLVMSGFLNQYELYQVLEALSKDSISDSEISAFLSVIKKHSVPLEFGLELPTIDVCGTGGDGKDTFNISTLVAFLLAALGHKVVKHGNYSATSVCGSSNLLEAIGVKLTDNQVILKEQLTESGVCFLHAPLFQPRLKELAPVRKLFGKPTVFNFLGPLLNPANPSHQLLGVATLGLFSKYQNLQPKIDRKLSLLYSDDGYDEISLTSDFRHLDQFGNIKRFNPLDLSLPLVTQAEIKGGQTVEDSAAIFMKIIKGAGTLAQESVVAINAAFALELVRPSGKLVENFEVARYALHTGQAYGVYQKLKQI